MTADTVLNTTPTYTVSHTFSTNDITGTFDGLTQGDVGVGETPVVDFTADPKVTKDGVDLYPINSEFGFLVTDFYGALEKDFVTNPEYSEGWAGDLKGAEGEQLGLVVSDAPTDTFKTPAKLGTWLSGLGGNTVKASTEHYAVMQHILSDQHYPEDPNAVYKLDDNLKMIGGDYDGMYIADILPIVGDTNGDGVTDIKDVLIPNESTIAENIAVGDDYSVTMKDDGKLLYRWGNTVKRPNDVRVEVELELPDEWKTPDPTTPDLMPLFRVTQAELLVNHTITNNPNDQIRPEDYENESAIGQLPTYKILDDGKWVTTDDYYAGDGTLYPAGTVLRDPALVEKLDGTKIAEIGATSEDLTEGYTNAWYTTMDREPFVAVLNDDGTDYIVGPRWRLQTDKYGQDLPSVVMPLDPSMPPPPTKDEVKYEVGEDTQTVINLLDWEFPISPLSISAGYQDDAGTVSENGLNMTDNFDVAFYIKGDIKPATLYDTQLIMSYEEITIYGSGGYVVGAEGSDYLVGQGANTFIGDTNTTEQGEDMFVLSYGVSNNWTEIQSSTILDFQVGVDTIGLFDFSVTDLNFSELVTQTIDASGLHINLLDFEIATLSGLTETLGLTDFLLLNRQVGERIPGTDFDDYLVGDAYDNVIFGLDGNDTLVGLAGDDRLQGGAGDDVLLGGDGADALIGGTGADILDGGKGIDTAIYTASASGVDANLDTGVATGGDAQGDTFVSVERLIGSEFNDILTGNSLANRLTGRDGDDVLGGGDGDDVLIGGLGADTLTGGNGVDSAIYSGSTVGVTVNLHTGVNANGDAAGDILSGVERIIGSSFDDTVTGDTADNFLFGRNGDDALDGGDGDDVLFGGQGADILTGGTGIDAALYTTSTAGVTINLQTGTATGGEATGDTLSGIERVFGSDFADILTGDAADNRLVGRGGDDILDGGIGDDVLIGDAGADLFIFNAGNDTIYGGDDIDLALYTGLMSDFAVVDNGNGFWDVTEIATGDIDVLNSVEVLSFTDGFLTA